MNAATEAVAVLKTLKNEDLGIAVDVIRNEHGFYVVNAYDTDASMRIESTSFFTFQSAIEHAKKFIADVIPAGTFVTI